MRHVTVAFALLALACGGDDPMRTYTGTDFPEWVSTPGIWHATRINGEEMPYRLGLHDEDCQEGPSYRYLGRIEAELESGPATAEWKPAEIGWGSGDEICNGIRGGSNALYDGSHRERTDSIFMSADWGRDGLRLYGGEWAGTPGGSFTMRGAYHSYGTTTEMEILFEPGEHPSY